MYRNVFRTYTNTQLEYVTENARLNLLLDRKAEIFERYFPTTTKYKDVDSHTNIHRDKMAEYLVELSKINSATGFSLEEEIENQRNRVGMIKNCLNVMDYAIENLKGIENELFCEIVKNRNTPTSAVNKVSERHSKEPQTIWKYYYPRIKKYLRKDDNV